jgi:hypothetical protein
MSGPRRLFGTLDEAAIKGRRARRSVFDDMSR